MDIRAITDTYYVAPQIDPTDLPDIAAAGIKTIICNRPDEEVPPNLQAAQLEIATHAAGLQFHVLPLTHQNMTLDVITRHMELAQHEGPVLAYCASGTRCTVAWAIGSAMQGLDIDDILASARQGGYALESMRPTLEGVSKTAGKD
jgi:uncharacterized protein (TIGR01244 family)